VHRKVNRLGLTRNRVLAFIGVLAVVPLVVALGMTGMAQISGGHASKAVSTSTGAPESSTRGTADPADLMRSHFKLKSDDGAAFAPNFSNYASRTLVSSPLLLFLAATHHRPSDYTSFLRTARASGYHVLALDYWNIGPSVQKTCGANPHCYGEVQRNRLMGTHPGPYSSVDHQNSIVNRLVAAVHQLELSDPEGGWGSYLNGNGIDWTKIVVAGHSQGGGESAYIAHIHRVRGALMFSSPVDSDGGVDASWMARPGVTPASRLYGFDATGDIFSKRVIASWNALGMGAFGGPQNTHAAPPYTSHELVTRVDLGDPGQSHLRNITNETPLTRSGQPVFAPVWKWMLTRLYRPSAASPATT
jgi:hypothetical protein